MGPNARTLLTAAVSTLAALLAAVFAVMLTQKLNDITRGEWLIFGVAFIALVMLIGALIPAALGEVASRQRFALLDKLGTEGKTLANRAKNVDFIEAPARRQLWFDFTDWHLRASKELSQHWSESPEERRGFDEVLGFRPPEQDYTTWCTPHVRLVTGTVDTLMAIIDHLKGTNS